MNKEETFPPNWTYQIIYHPIPDPENNKTDPGEAKIYAANGDAIWEGVFWSIEEICKKAWDMFGIPKTEWIGMMNELERKF